MKTAPRMQHLQTHFFAALNGRVAALQVAGRDVIRLDEGSPDLPPAAHIIEALERSARQPDRHGYQPHRGTPALRQAWAQMYRREYGVELDPESEVLPLLGSKEGIFHLALAVIEARDIVLAPDPGYITYTRGTLAAGGEIYKLPLLQEVNYLPNLDFIPADVLRRARMLWLNYPNNPTAAVAPPAYFESVVAFARQHNLLLCHDAAYAQVAFDGYKPPSLLQAPGAKEIAVEFNTLSKSHNMAGWRAAAAVGSPQALQALYTLKTNADSGHFLPVMEAAVAALTGDQSWLAGRNEIYRQRRDVVLAGLRAVGMIAAEPRASLYVWAPLPAGWDRSAEFCAAALEGAGVSFTPGTVFGGAGEGYIRISITASQERLEEAMRRLREWMEQ